MSRIFADTLYFVAITLKNDAWHQEALRLQAANGNAHLVTTEEVLSEYLTSLAKMGQVHRDRATFIVRQLLESDRITVLYQSHETFLAGLTLYEQRSDKGYSLTDCISMTAMREHGITEILTNDHHFTQEGFTILIHR